MQEKDLQQEKQESFPTETSEDYKDDDTIYVTSVQIQKETANISNKIMELKQETLQLLDVYNLCIDDKLKAKNKSRQEMNGEDNIRTSIQT